ncbi:hypothetical protein G5B40_11530 [Pikeienuella piscinae]|uniref:Uncharacterized protein n=1 Tax=Pikeienuella piscinae TaxID=2748098 RepID=A0A7L5C0I2_9RHOB|nr:hypothetical protein [Pikeienuella piscinae]QIE56026.1 hypothetical protein G5B40_11530 [Pikeienuella piscinae]
MNVWSRPRLFALAAASAVVAIFIAANAHLVFVAFSSMPECVPHLKSPTGGAATYRAAKPSC